MIQWAGHGALLLSRTNTNLSKSDLRMMQTLFGGTRALEAPEQQPLCMETLQVGPSMVQQNWLKNRRSLLAGVPHDI